MVALPRAPVVPALSGYTGHLIRAAYMAAQDMARTALPVDSQPREFGILTMLAREGPRSQQQLSAMLGVNRTIMVQVVDRLEAKGLVERKRNPADRRSYAIEPTESGLRALDELTPKMLDVEGRFVGRLTAAEHQRLNDLLRALLAGWGHTAPAPLAERTGYLLAAAFRAGADRFEAALAPVDIEPRHFGALATIAASAPCTQQVVAEQLGVTGPAVVAVVDELERRGFVERRRNPEGRRSYALEPTALGTATMREAEGAIKAVSASFAEVLGDDGDAELRTLLRRLLGLDELSG